MDHDENKAAQLARVAAAIDVYIGYDLALLCRLQGWSDEDAERMRQKDLLEIAHIAIDTMQEIKRES